jgi:hypothetical protein
VQRIFQELPLQEQPHQEFAEAYVALYSQVVVVVAVLQGLR